MQSRKYIFCIAAVFFFMALNKGQTSEYFIKAGFIEKFVRFTTWPDSIHAPQKPNNLYLGIIGNSPFKNELTDIFEVSAPHGKKVVIKHLKSVHEIQSCQILFVSRTERKRLAKIIESAKKYPVLTIGDTRGYANEGLIVNFYVTVEQTIHFEINESALKASGLKMNLLLLEIAKIIKE